jgi:HEAT repeat protein
MLAVNINQRLEEADKLNIFTTLPIAIEVQPDHNLYKLLAELSSDTSWGDRQIAAKKIGYMRSSEALPGLLAALPAEPFWMVRCAIVQALEMIGDPMVIHTLREIAKIDGFQVVRSYAAKAVERLSQGV